MTDNINNTSSKNTSSNNTYTKLYSLLNDIQDECVQKDVVQENSNLKGGKKKSASKKLPPFKISSPDPYQRFLAIHIKNYPQSKFLENLHKNIEQLNSKEDVQEYIDQNFVFY